MSACDVGVGGSAWHACVVTGDWCGAPGYLLTKESGAGPGSVHGQTQRVRLGCTTVPVLSVRIRFVWYSYRPRRLVRCMLTYARSFPREGEGREAYVEDLKQERGVHDAHALLTYFLSSKQNTVHPSSMISIIKACLEAEVIEGIKGLQSLVIKILELNNDHLLLLTLATED
jgi:hypothetical protein